LHSVRFKAQTSGQGELPLVVKSGAALADWKFVLSSPWPLVRACTSNRPAGASLLPRLGRCPRHALLAG